MFTFISDSLPLLFSCEIYSYFISKKNHIAAASFITGYVYKLVIIESDLQFVFYEYMFYFCLQESGPPVVENTEVRPSLDIPTQQVDDTYPDSLNHLSSKESCLVVFKHQTNIVTSNNSVTSDHHKSVCQSSETQAFPWHSSSSEYFDSINNSGSGVFQNSSILHSFSLYQDHYLQSSVQREGLAECDSLEKERTGVELNGIMVDTDVEGGNFIVSSVPSRNLWTKADN